MLSVPIPQSPIPPEVTGGLAVLAIGAAVRACRFIGRALRRRRIRRAVRVVLAAVWLLLEDEESAERR